MIQCTIHLLSRSNLDKVIQNTYTHIINSDYIHVTTSAIYVYLIKKVIYMYLYMYNHAYA